MSMKFYKAYNFIDKDPVIDVARTAIKDAGLTYRQVSELSDVSEGTLVSWFHGKTKRPQYCTVLAVMRGIGMEQRWVKAHK